MAPTRAWPTPTGRLVADDRPGLGACLVVELADAWRTLPEVDAALSGGRAFLERPMVSGVAPLVGDDGGHAGLAYATGRAVPLSALLDGARRRGIPLGPRAAVELGWLAASTLADAAATGPLQGVFCHGDVSPWRLAVQATGGLTVLGYGLPELEAARARRAGEAPSDAAARYAPPERSPTRDRGGLEDLRSDLFSLALVLAEVATGEPLPAAADDAAAGLARRTRLPAPLVDLLGGLLAARPDARRRPEAAVRALEVLARHPLPGPSLAEVVARAAERPEPEAPLARSGATATRTLALGAPEGIGPRPVRPAPPPDVPRPRRAPPLAASEAPPPRRPEDRARGLVPPDDVPVARPRRARSPDEPTEP